VAVVVVVEAVAVVILLVGKETNGVGDEADAPAVFTMVDDNTIDFFEEIADPTVVV
jgi:hypothetical protein